MPSTTFTHSDDGSTYTVPSGINVVKFEVYGAGGGASSGSGGDGGYASGILTGLSGGETFTVYAGGGGNDFDFSSGQDGVGGTGAWYNGGDGGSDGGSGADGGSGGGAASGVIRDSDGFVMVAGGGGGGGSGSGDENENSGGGPGGGGARGGLGGSALETGTDAQDAEGGTEGTEGGNGADGDFFAGSNGENGDGVVHTSLEKTTTISGGGNQGSTDGESDGFGEDGEVVITEVVPDAPSISVTSHSNTSVTLDIGNTDYEDSATLSYKEQNDSTWIDFATYSAGEIPLTETVDGLNEGGGYDFQITVSNTAGSSSNLASQITDLPAPTNLSVTNFSQTTIDLEWDLQSVDETSVRIFRSKSGDPYQEITDLPLPPGTESYQDTDLLNATEYTYFVQASTLYTTSDSNTVTQVTEIYNPENLQDISDTRNRIDVTWESDLNEGNFYIEYERLYDNSIQKSETINYTTTSSFIDNVEDGVEYEVRVRSETSEVTGDYTSIVTRVFIPHSRFTQKVIDGQGNIELQWEKIDTFNGGLYEIYRSETQGNLGNKIATLSDTITRYVDDNTEFNTEYYYTLRRVIE